MRFPVPSKQQRVAIQTRLGGFFNTHDEKWFRQGVRYVVRFYKLPMPRVVWYENLGPNAGETLENGTIRLIHPENWKKNRKYNTEQEWVDTALHELGHYVLWADAERKAILFARRMKK